MTSFKCYYIILIKVNTQFHAIIALLSDYDKRAVYRNPLSASYVIYPEGGGIKRFTPFHWCDVDHAVTGVTSITPSLV